MQKYLDDSLDKDEDPVVSEVMREEEIFIDFPSNRKGKTILKVNDSYRLIRQITLY